MPEPTFISPKIFLRTVVKMNGMTEDDRHTMHTQLVRRQPGQPGIFTYPVWMFRLHDSCSGSIHFLYPGRYSEPGDQ
jgi:hypothetical protein